MDQPTAAVPELQLDQTPPSPGAKPAGRKGWIAAIGVLVLIALVFLGIWVYNQTTLQKPLANVLASDGRNKNVDAKARYDGWIDTGTVVFDLSSISGESSAMDVFRVLLQFAQT